MNASRKHTAPRPGEIAKRSGDVAPASYDANAHAVDCVLSQGSPVRRFYGTEVLRISKDAVDTTRLNSGGIPLLDSHQQTGIGNALGRVVTTWIKGGELWGRLVFNATPAGKLAEAMVARGELRAVSVGYTVEACKVTDADGREVDAAYASFEENLNFEATKWTLLEVSMVTVPADASAGVRSLAGTIKGAPQFIRDARARMGARQRMVERLTIAGAKLRMLRRQLKALP